MASMSARWLPACLMALATCLAPRSAQANATFEFSLSGQLSQPDGCGNADCSVPGGLVFPWTGELTVVLDSGADGVYDNTGLVSFDMRSNCCSVHEPSDGPIPFFASFLVAGGRLTSMDATSYDPVIPVVVTTFSGLTVSYDQPQIFHSPETLGSAVLTPVPEAATWAMLVLGVALLGAIRLGIRRP
jgi:hypothetical protein